jgi:hypothetical protein
MLTKKVLCLQIMKAFGLEGHVRTYMQKGVCQVYGADTKK